jgi:DNA-binding response OmpR family regulator
LNLPAHKLFRKGREVEVTPKEFRLLAYFVSRRGCALALNAVWGHSIMVTSRSIDRCVATLRAKIGPAYIETICDIGYRFEAGGE